MVHISAQPLTLDTFLQRSETQPASEFIHNQITQKPMPQGEHSTLQSELVNAINAVGKPRRMAYAFPELRCVFGGAAIVPDIVVFRWPRIPRTASGRIANRFEICPDWAIEILSPEQTQTKPLEKLLHCIDHGTEWGWLLDPEADSILVISADSRIKLYQDLDPLPLLPELELVLSANDIFSWLSLPE
ncbi:Uma2 family endonuclease [Acaryochloris sp. IP29b_bin.148]|uniref:Uma2 family endonuclease n=1 Tax=Acaryochloris sp. IP29b_bin.148 TaxID=2969218 RepID=UPI002637AAAA|nr:Uma2 family endonuclease [Acaryochloris sp. IP29b_bin.148]